MNKERMLLVADAIEKEEIAKFRMMDFIRHAHCGTVACVAGFTHILINAAAKDDPDNFLSYSRQNTAGDYLGLPHSDAYELFFAASMNEGDEDEEREGYVVLDEDDYSKHGAKAIRWMVANERINWKEALTALGVLS